MQPKQDHAVKVMQTVEQQIKFNRFSLRLQAVASISK